MPHPFNDRHQRLEFHRILPDFGPPSILLKSLPRLPYGEFPRFAALQRLEVRLPRLRIWFSVALSLHVTDLPCGLGHSCAQYLLTGPVGRVFRHAWPGDFVAPLCASRDTNPVSMPNNSGKLSSKLVTTEPPPSATRLLMRLLHVQGPRLEAFKSHWGCKCASGQVQRGG